MFLETAFIFPFSTWWAVPFCENDNLNLVVVIELQEYIQYFCTVCHLVFFPCYLLNCIFFFFPMTMWNAYSFKQCYEILRTDNSNLIAFTHLLKMLEKIQCKVHFLKTIPFTSCLNIIFLEDISILFEFPVYREIYAILSVRIHNRLQTSRKK